MRFPGPDFNKMKRFTSLISIAMAEPAADMQGTGELLAWLEQEPDADAVADLAALQEHVRAHVGRGLGAEARRGLLERFGVRALDISGRFRSQLLAATLPLSRELHAAAVQLSATLLELAAAFGTLAGERRRGVQAADEERLVVRGLTLVGEVYALATMASAPAPAGLWRLAHGLGGGPQAVAGALTAGDAIYRRLLAVAVAQPESLTARELAWLFDFLDADGACGELSVALPQPASAGWWIDPEADAPPLALLRQAPPSGAELWYFSPTPLARALAVRLGRLEAELAEAESSGVAVDAEPFGMQDADLPLGLTRLEIVSLLRRLQVRWMAPPLRELPRRQQQYTVQVCVGLRAIWALGRGVPGQGRVLEWKVLNESPGGYAIINVSGMDEAIAAGGALALRRDASEPWSVCLVRWVRSDGPGQIELGLQVIAVSYQSIQVGFRGGQLQTMAPALALAAMEPVRRHPAILAPAGTYASRRFVFVRETGHLYVAQGRALGLDLQTANIELFQYETDPYPL